MTKAPTIADTSSGEHDDSQRVKIRMHGNAQILILFRIKKKLSQV